MIRLYRHWRDRLLGDPAVRDRLGRSRIGAAVADGHAGRLFGLVTGFAGSRMIAAAVELGLFERLATSPASLDEVATTGALPLASARALADAMVGCGLWLRQRDGALRLTIDGLVIATDPAIRAMIAHDRLLAADLLDPVATLRAGRGSALASFWPYSGGGDAAGYAALMSASTTFAGSQLAASHDFGRYAHVMDVGGGEGGFVRLLATRWPALRLTLVELPAVAERAAARLADLPQVKVVARMPGAALPDRADAITMVRVLHDQDDAGAEAMVRAAAAALAPGGRLIVAEPMRRRGRDPVGTYFAAYFAAMGSGRLRTRAQVRTMMRNSGLRPCSAIRRRFLLTSEMAFRPASIRIDIN